MALGYKNWNGTADPKGFPDLHKAALYFADLEEAEACMWARREAAEKKQDNRQLQ